MTAYWVYRLAFLGFDGTIAFIEKVGEIMQQVVIATHNLGKVEEFKSLMNELGLEFTCLSDYPPIPEPEENGRTFAANARIKAKYYAKETGKLCLADDSGLEVLSLKGAPGVRSARYAGEEATDEENNELLLANMKMQVRRNCRFFCALAVANPEGKILAETSGIVMGFFSTNPMGPMALAMIRCSGPRSCTLLWGKQLWKKRTASVTGPRLSASW